MSGRRNWDRARMDARMRDLAPAAPLKGGYRPTPKQLDYLDTLARQCGEQTPQALTRQHASQLIDAFRRELDEPM